MFLTQTCLFSRPNMTRQPSLLPAFEPLSSSPLPRPSERKYAEHAELPKAQLKYYPTPVPTSSTGMLPSSPPARPALERTTSTFSGGVRELTAGRAVMHTALVYQSPCPHACATPAGMSGVQHGEHGEGPYATSPGQYPTLPSRSRAQRNLVSSQSPRKPLGLTA